MVTDDDSQTRNDNKKRIDPSQRALVLIGLQNEVASIGGRLFDDTMKDVIDSDGMLDKTRDLADAARSMGTHVFHLPAFNSNIREVNNGQTDDTSTVGDFLSNTLSRFFKEDHSH